MSEEGKFVDFDPENVEADPAVEALLNRGERRQAEARLSRKERDKKMRERKKMQARLKGRATYDLPASLKERIAAIAEGHQTSASQVAALFLLQALEAFDQGEIDLEGYKVPSNSPRYEWNLDLPETD